MRQFTEADVAAVIAASPVGMQGGFPAKPMAPLSAGIPPGGASAPSPLTSPPAAPPPQLPGRPMSSPAPLGGSLGGQPLGAAPLGGQPLGGPAPLGGPSPLGAPLNQGGGLGGATQPIPNYVQSTVQMPAQANPQVQVRMSLTGEVIEDVAPPPPMPAPGPPSPYGAPACGPPPPAPRSIHGSRVALATAHGSEAVSAQMVQQAMAQVDRDFALKWERSLAIILPSVVICLLIAKFVPDSFLWVGLAACFMVGLGLGSTRAIVPFDEAYLDCTAILLVSYLCGPVAGIGAYALVGLIKQEWNTAALSVLIGHIIVRAAFALAFPDGVPYFTLIPYVHFMNPIKMASFMATALSFGGWMMSSFFRPVNE